MSTHRHACYTHTQKGLFFIKGAMPVFFPTPREKYRGTPLISITVSLPTLRHTHWVNKEDVDWRGKCKMRAKVSLLNYANVVFHLVPISAISKMGKWEPAVYEGGSCSHGWGKRAEIHKRTHRYEVFVKTGSKQLNVNRHSVSHHALPQKK